MSVAKRFKLLTTHCAILSASLCTSVSAEGHKVPDIEGLTVSGYVKIDARHSSGDVAYRDFWIGTGQALDEDQDTFKMTARQSRIKLNYEKAGVQLFLEADFYGSDGNEVISNSYDPRLRQLFVKHENLLVGQAWSNLMNLYAYPESVSFGGPLNAEVFIRQPQIRFTYEGLSVALENPETTGTESQNDELPDLTLRYQWDSELAHLSVSGLASHIAEGSADETALAFFLAGRLNIGDSTDIRFQYSTGNSGRYVGTGLTNFIIDGELEEVDAYVVGLQHRFSPKYRMNLYTGHSETDIQDRETRHSAINLITELEAGYSIGFELGRFELKPLDASSDYTQLSLTYPF